MPNKFLYPSGHRGLHFSLGPLGWVTKFVLIFVFHCSSGGPINVSSLESAGRPNPVSAYFRLCHDTFAWIGQCAVKIKKNVHNALVQLLSESVHSSMVCDRLTLMPMMNLFIAIEAVSPWLGLFSLLRYLSSPEFLEKAALF
jgi:hypothetical protein